MITNVAKYSVIPEYYESPLYEVHIDFYYCELEIVFTVRFKFDNYSGLCICEVYSIDNKILSEQHRTFKGFIDESLNWKYDLINSCQSMWIKLLNPNNENCKVIDK